ncbi:CU044_5270 family protein [Nonomuraea sp. NPDC049684]|uniref:CU044_5270 family protein n=1 Tax=Nonomuraea sp. NPDC049684 TaxID=3364356 RepID=UPI0037AC4249
MDDEIRTFADGRPAAPPYEPQARARARERLLAEARGGRRLRLPRLGWQTAAAFGVTVVLVGGVAVALSGQGGTDARPATSVMLAAGELNPRPDQFILIESDTMYGSRSIDASGGQSRYLYRQHRRIWKSVDGSKDGLLQIEGREPRPWPGEPLPADATSWQGSEWNRLASCPDLRGPYRDDYAYLSTLPTDATAMRDRLYQPVPGGGKDGDPDAVAFARAGDLVRENYLPKAQRDALFEAVKTIPGVEAAEGVADSSGRVGVALGRVAGWGVREELIFDPAGHTFLGERQVVVDAKAGAPKDSVLALTAQLDVSVVDALPEAPDAAADASCMPETQAPVPTPSESGSTTSEPPTAEATITFTREPAAGAPSAEPSEEPRPTPTGTAVPTGEPQPTRTVTVEPSASAGS